LLFPVSIEDVSGIENCDQTESNTSEIGKRGKAGIGKSLLLSGQKNITAPENIL
jgi:hypothetical protein